MCRNLSVMLEAFFLFFFFFFFWDHSVRGSLDVIVRD
jgi:hypothetical protein